MFFEEDLRGTIAQFFFLYSAGILSRSYLAWLPWIGHCWPISVNPPSKRELLTARKLFFCASK